MAGISRITTDLVLELDGNSPFKYVMAKQGDEDTRALSITLLENKKEYVIPSGVRVEVRYYKPDAKMVIANCTISNNKIIMEYTSQMLAVHGTGKGEVVLISGTSELKTATFYTNICENVFNVNGLISDHEFQNMAAAIIKADEAAEKAKANANEAKAKADLANTAATNANAARTSANTAATNANTAATSANTAATNANAAATRVDAAITTANTAATAANDAARDANAAKTNATNAANNASSKASLADVAATNANTQANRANDIATEVERKLEEGAFTGPEGPKGEAGEPFQISKTYPSIAAMNTGYASDGVEIGQFAVIDTGSVQDVDNGKLYMKGATKYTFITDLSGVDGMRGPEGPRGLQGDRGPEGPEGPKGEAGEINVNNPLSFQVATTRANIESGEKLGVILGKIKKVIADLGAAAFAGLVNNLTHTSSSAALDARQGPIIKKLIDEKVSMEDLLTTPIEFDDGLDD